MSQTGKEILAYCSACKMDLAGLIVAMQGDQIKKVECKTCKKIHVYKAPKGITEPGQAPKKRASRKKAVDAESSATSVEAEWEKLMTANKAAPFKNYVTKGQFLLGDKLNHLTFGEGIVNKLIYPNKIEVIFRTDLKVLIHGG